MNWTGPYVGGIVLDLGHSTLRTGYSGDYFPSQMCPSSVGTGCDFDVFPLIPSSKYKFPFVEHSKYFDLLEDKHVINKETYMRSIRGSLSGRVHDKVMIEHLRCACKNPDLSDVSLLVGAHHYDKNCWDNFNNYMIAEVDPNKLPNPKELTPSTVLKNMNSFNSVFSGLCELSGSRPVFIIESSQTSKKNRMLETEIMFEELGVPGIFFGNGSQLASYSVGLVNSVVIDIGSAKTSVSSLVDDEILEYKECNIGGDQVDAILLNLLLKTSQENFSYIMNHPEYNLGVSYLKHLAERDSIDIANRPFTKQIPMEVFRIHEELKTLKESILRVSGFPLYVSTEMNSTAHLPDGESFDYQEDGLKLRGLSKVKGTNSEIPLDAKDVPNFERATPFQLVALSCEILFNPNIAYVPKNMTLPPFKGLVSLCEEIVKDNSLYRKDIFSQIALVGGVGCSSGLQERLGAELARASLKSPQESPLSGLKFKFVTFNSKMASRHASWIGGSIISSLGSFHNCWISRSEYNEHGPNISNRKGGSTKNLK